MADQLSIYMLAVAFFFMAFIYLILSIYCLTRIYRVMTLDKPLFLARIFYISIFLVCVSYLLAMIIFLISVGDSPDKDKEKDGFKRIFVDTLYIPDSIFWVLYLALYWQVLNLFYAGHMQSGNLISMPDRFDPLSSSNLSRLLYLLFFYTIGQTVVIVLFNVNRLQYGIYVIINIALNASIPISLVISELYLNFRFSGSPFRSKNFEKVTVQLNRLIGFLSVMRCVQLVLNILLLSYDEEVFYFFSGGTSLSNIWKIFMVCFYIADLLLVSVIPFLFALSENFLKIFLLDLRQDVLLSEEENGSNKPGLQIVAYDKTQSMQNLQNRLSASGSGVRLKPQFRNIEDSSYVDRKLINFRIADLTFGANKSRPNGLGKIQIGASGSMASMEPYAFRVIEFQQLSSYVLEEVETEIKRINELKHDYVSHIHGWVSDPKQILLAYRYYSNGSLHDFIYQKESEDSSQAPEQKFENRLLIAIQLARGIQYLHNQKFPHGHLSTNNVMLNKNHRVKIVDLGFVPLKKYCSIIFGYINKSRFTAPEILGERGNVVQNVTKEADIYSLGMILYEMFTEKIPFKDLPLKEISKVVIEQHGRPKIEQEQTGEDVSILIRWCWQQDPAKRPDIAEVVKALENIKESLDQNHGARS